MLNKGFSPGGDHRFSLSLTLRSIVCCVSRHLRDGICNFGATLGSFPCLHSLLLLCISLGTFLFYSTLGLSSTPHCLPLPLLPLLALPPSFLGQFLLCSDFLPVFLQQSQSQRSLLSSCPVTHSSLKSILRCWEQLWATKDRAEGSRTSP